MSDTVRLTVLTGPHRGQRFCFRGPTRCQVGRAADCFVRLAGADRDLMISRHHCELDIAPPAVSVQDLGSHNGTFINGHPVGGAEAESDGGRVENGDVVTVGGTSFVVDLVNCLDHTDVDCDPGWKPGQVALVDCPVRCPVDGAAPAVGCSVGGPGGME